MTDQQTKPVQDPYITNLESQYKNLQAKRDKARANRFTEVVLKIEAKMDKVSEKLVRALVKRQKKV